MPHQCTACGRTFDDGSKEMLSGCPDCGGNKFQFHPEESAGGKPEEPPDPPERPDPPVDSSVARTVGNAATAVRDIVGGDSSNTERREPSESLGQEAERGSARTAHSDSTRKTPGSGKQPGTRGKRKQPSTREQQSSTQNPRGGTREDSAQANARSEVVAHEDLPPAPETSTRSRPTPVMDEASESEKRRQERPDLSELREQLNEQFESIRVLEPGQYELNLMELFDREEYIIALQEDGKYTIQVPERWNE